MKRVYYTRAHYRIGTVHGVNCAACLDTEGEDAILILTWDKREARQVGRRHERDHRRAER